MKRVVPVLLIEAALFSIFVAVWAGAGRATQTSPANDATKIAWYLKGQADALFPSRGWQTLSLSCKPAGRYAVCRIKVRVTGRGVYCANGTYRVVGFGIKGQTSKPYLCGKKSKGPAS